MFLFNNCICHLDISQCARPYSFQQIILALNSRLMCIQPEKNMCVLCFVCLKQQLLIFGFRYTYALLLLDLKTKMTGRALVTTPLMKSDIMICLTRKE